VLYSSEVRRALISLTVRFSQIGIPNGRRQIASWPKAQFYPRESEDFLKRSQDPVCASFAQERLENARHPGLARLINGMC